MQLVNAVLAVALTAAPWLLLGLLAAGMLKAWVPEAALRRWVGGRGLGATARAAVIGAPLPLCSCGAIPTALAMHRAGAGRGPTTAFLIGTPGIGVDSLAISYALLGPFMALARAAGAVVTAVTTGLLVARSGGGAAASAASGCGGGCGGGSCAGESAPTRLSAAARLRGGVAYAYTDLLDDISTWLFIGLLVAGLLMTFVPPQAFAAYGSGLLPMLVLAAIGIPLYICATAATPIAAGMLLAGVSPGTALVFLLAAPITSLATLGVLRREMGNAALGYYLFGIGVTVVLFGLLVDAAVAWAGVDVVAQLGAARELLPPWLEWAALAVLVALAVRPVRRLAGRFVPA